MTRLTFLSSACLLALGCAEAMPHELADARAAYTRAQSSPASKLNPAELHTAKEALQKAEISFEDEGDTFKTRDRAYIAMRKARIAESHAAMIEANRYTNDLREQTRQMESAALDSAQHTLDAQGKALTTERARREEAEKRAEQARADLARIAAVAKTERGTVITLAGGVLFASGKSQLLPGAEAKLSEVADALVSGSPDSTMEVEGHTDSQGPDERNLKLSEARAESVRAYLVSHGVAADRITAKGLGEARPVADNKSPEGRANNRRVEIVVHDQGAATEPSARGTETGTVPGQRPADSVPPSTPTP